jgi:hypothetical protein
MENILSCVLVACTVAYTYINLKQLKESVLIRKLKTSPFLIAYLKSTEDHTVLRLHIKNAGEGVAKNVKIKVLNDCNQFTINDRLMSSVGILKHGLNIFPPQEEFKYYVDTWNRINVDSFIELNISYEGSDGEKFNETYKLPFNQYAGQDYATPPDTYIGKIAYHLDRLNGTISQCQTSIR